MINKNIAVCLLCLLLAMSAAATDKPRHFEYSDSIADCIVFQNIGITPALLHQAKLAPPDEAVAAQIIASFDGAFWKLGQALNHASISQDEFIAKRDTMVAEAHKQFDLHLSQTGNSRFNGYIRQERMKIKAATEHPTEN